MLRHAVTALVVIVCGVVITLLFVRQGYVPAAAARDDVAEATAAMDVCWETLVPLSGEIIEGMRDTQHRAERFAQIMAPARKRCSLAEREIATALERHPSDAAIPKLREKLGLSRGWIRDLDNAFAAYEAAAKQGSAAQELAALQALLQ